MKQKPKRKPRGKMKPVAPEMTRLASDVRFVQEFCADADTDIVLDADPELRKAIRAVEDSFVVPELRKAVEHGELPEVVRAIKRLPKETDSQRHVRFAYLSLCHGSPPFPTFKALMQKLNERADGKTDCVPPERTVRDIVDRLRLPMADSKTGRRFAKKRLN